MYFAGQPSRNPSDPDYVPSIFSYTPLRKKDENILQAKVERHQRIVEREQKKDRSTAAQALLKLFEEDENTVPGTETQTDKIYSNDAYTQTDITLPLLNSIIETNNYFKICHDANVVEKKNIICEFNLKIKELQEIKDKCTTLENKIKQLSVENDILHETFRQKIISFNNLDGNDKKLKFYTGLPNCETFKVIYEEAKVHAKRKKSKLDPMDEMLLTLLKIRQNLANEDLAHRFGVSISYVTKAFHRWLNALYKCLGGLVMWPETDVMELPEVFQNEQFRKVRCIIDCTEIFIERPSVLKARSQTYSNYKRHNTVKFLVGISPSGAVIFLSKCWGGRVSDNQITLESGFLDKLLPGDIILADRGFTMNEEVLFKGAKLVVPSFTKGKSQLSAKEVEESRFMSRARIHVERVIGRLKDFKIIQGTMPLTIVKRVDDDDTTCDKIVRVISGIVNLNDQLL